MGHAGGPGSTDGVAAAGIVIGAGPDLPEAPGSGRDWIAVDLALRPGHSGGPLVDHQARLIGMSTMMAGLEVGMAVPAHVLSGAPPVGPVTLNGNRLAFSSVSDGHSTPRWSNMEWSPWLPIIGCPNPRQAGGIR